MLGANIAQLGPEVSSIATDREKTARSLGRMAAVRQSGSAGVGWDVSKHSRTNRRFAHLSGLFAGADRHIQMGNLPKLRELGRAHDRGSGLISGMLNRALDNIFGDAFSFTPNTGDPNLNAVVKTYIKGRMKKEVCDAAGVDNFVAMARTAIRAIWTDGDHLLVFRPDGAMIPFEADQIITPTKRPTTTGHTVVMGIETDGLGRHYKYHVSQRPTTGIKTTTAEVDPSNTLFPSWRTRARQTRGVPYIAAALAIYERLDGFINWETFAAELNARATMKITQQPSEDPPDGQEDNEDPSTNDTFSKVEKMEGGEVFDLAPGEDVGFVESTRPGPEFSPYIITVGRIEIGRAHV